jgi:endonuclease/exonuclease/phosphatase family metal-dependent hydrolase
MSDSTEAARSLPAEQGPVRTMRIATWNLQRGTSAPIRQAQRAVIQELAADILVLTEPDGSYEHGPGAVTSPRLREARKGTESWVAIVGSSVEPVELDIPFERMAVAARAGVGGKNVIIYGSVLPWGTIRSQAPELVRDDECSFDTFARFLREQVADVLELRRAYPGAVMIWAGDFNQTVRGPVGGSRQRHALLTDALETIELTAWNGAAAHARPGLCAVDLICGPSERPTESQGRIDPVRNGVTMSDHAGYWIDL